MSALSRLQIATCAARGNTGLRPRPPASRSTGTGSDREPGCCAGSAAPSFPGRWASRRRRASLRRVEGGSPAET
eukprot:scaffold7266_cov403-Prasinococcus_capsulatus_cf.AAC.1